ncbi:hypothetical protein CC2G_015275 [Coprinopsis cinerea AmutBmut pab1-1]|nr:hypothetical protein CC2G_006661 [Coprinopsis cinerea AmutBmut pab1-1]KAG2002067.1 hypothetical protein CC2G_004820 [Coprinopsis cinerea AmutBmut pab1-1]KAG2007557.1 hypothetical protein CC2G_015251 [Coprinopsis cinerea AmutBmut pab1-1]KAG2007560.1 hypothetical protein CC2G_015254 [Coprinopsis cinerea AmutBmut pab1-1]KAG2007569.1 hypothetical protein CC2G_015263 [Coprinopsis cinerea AmutBmut pab1-1]
MSTGYNPPDRLGGHFRAGSPCTLSPEVPCSPPGLKGIRKFTNTFGLIWSGYQQANITSPAKGTEEDQTTWVAYYMKGKSEWADQSMVIARVGRVLEYQT